MMIIKSKPLLVIGISFVVIGLMTGLMQNCNGVKMTAPTAAPKLFLSTEWQTHKIPLGYYFETYPVEEGTFLELRPNGQDKQIVTIDSKGVMRRNGKIVERIGDSTQYIDVRSKPQYAGKEYIFLLSRGN